ncbi:hypothetical protein PV04_10003 [Phialophora macrospora]|uniref:Uncharacterized protein n=1 Tax=Phialophora macrospora TaxID=1851006 RepID=A0A0D2F5G2_9EURO|nr:hypothetical protein PV04_10003 [Phialophora macrospora]
MNKEMRSFTSDPRDRMKRTAWRDVVETVCAVDDERRRDAGESRRNTSSTTDTSIWEGTLLYWQVRLASVGKALLREWLIYRLTCWPYFNRVGATYERAGSQGKPKCPFSANQDTVCSNSGKAHT